MSWKEMEMLRIRRRGRAGGGEFWVQAEWEKGEFNMY